MQQDPVIIFIYKNYIYTRRWSNERIKTKNTMFQENSNTLTNMAWNTRFKENTCRPATPIWPKLYMNIWPKSRQIYVYIIKSARIYISSISSKYIGFLQDLCSTGAKTNKVINLLTLYYVVVSCPCYYGRQIFSLILLNP